MNDHPITFNTPTAFKLKRGSAAKGRREFRARLVRAGRITRADGSPGPITIPPETLSEASTAGMFNSLAVFADHPGFFEGPKVKHLIGVTRNASFNEGTQGVDATIRFYTATDGDGQANTTLANTLVEMLDAIIEDEADGIPPPNIGISLVFWPVWAEGDNNPRILEGFRKIDSADLVFSPAADGRILEALSAYSQTGSTEGGSMSTRNVVDDVTPAMSTELPDETTEAGLTSQPAPGERQMPLPLAQPAPEASGPEAWIEAARQAAIPGILAGSGLPQVSQNRLSRMHWSTPEELQEAIEEERQYLATLQEMNVVQVGGSHPRGAGGPIRVSGMLNGRDAAEMAVNWLFGVKGAEAPDFHFRNFANLYVAMTGDAEFRGVYNASKVMLAGADTTALADLAANAMNKIIVDHMASLTHYRWYEMVAVPTANDGSLHDMQWTDVGGITTLPAVTEGAAYDEITMADVKEVDSFVKYGGYVGITREMIRKSDIQRIQAVPRALAAASVKTRSAKIADIFTSNSGVGPTLDQDSTALFHANHSNVQTTALGTDTTAWRAATLECFNGTEIGSGDKIGVFARFLLVPPDLYYVALSNFGYGEGFPTSYLPEAVSPSTPAGDPRPLPIAVPHFTDANDWAYMADPAVWPVIHMSFSADPSGRTFPAPEVFSVTSETAGLMFSNDTLPVKIRDEFAYGVNGYRGIGKRNVA